MNETCTASGMSGNVYANLLSLSNKGKGISNIFLLSNSNEIKKERFVDKKTNQLLLRVDSNDKCETIERSEISEHIKIGYECVIVSDYNKGYLSNKDICDLGRSSRKLSVLDSKRKLTKEIVESFTFIKLNKLESIINHQIVSEYPDKFLITCGDDGVRYNGTIFPVDKKIQTFDVSGAGDTFVAAFVLKKLSGSSIEESIYFAQACCSQVIQKRGTAVYEW